MYYILTFSIGVVIGGMIFGLLISSSILRDKQDTYMEGYIKGLNEGKVK